VLTIPAAATLRGKLIDGSLPNLLLPEEGTAPPPATVLPDAEQRRAVRLVLSAQASHESRRLIGWLDGGH
jgi:hypothetical protein